MQMSRRGSGRLSRRLALVGMAIYALFLVASPFEHHDLSCELKTPQHCTSCTSTQLGSDTHVVLSPGAAQLADAGRANAFIVLAEGTLLAVRSSGRSPPIHS
jgi:hypothetical protein